MLLRIATAKKGKLFIDCRSYGNEAVHAMSGYLKEVLSVVLVGNK
jgi:hypothetical protein